jgi:hypothetical protein
MFPLEEAEHCRRLACAFEGKAEASFLLKAAQAFEELAAHGSPWHFASETIVSQSKPSGEGIRLF